MIKTRLSHLPRYHDGFRVTFHEDRLDEPVRWKRPRRIFVCSLGDLFHEDVPIEFIQRVWAAMIECQQHTFMVLTKRPERMLDILTRWITGRAAMSSGKYTSHIWLGVTAENQARADERIPVLLDTPVAHKFVSCEPLLGPVNLWGKVRRSCSCPEQFHKRYCPACHGTGWVPPLLHDPTDLCRPDECSGWSTLDYVIAGGESGPNRREMDPDWARSLRDQCAAADVPFHFKQHSGPRPGMNPVLDGVEYKAMPPFEVVR